MASKPIIMTITDSAKNAMLDSENTGITLRLERLAIGSGRYNPSGSETALENEISRHVITVGDIEPATHTLRLFSVVKATTETEVWELGLYDTENRLFALASSTDKPLFKVYPDIDFVGNFAIKLDAFNASKVQVVTDPNGALSLVLMSHHLAHADPHPQYLNKLRHQMLMRQAYPIGYPHWTSQNIDPKPFFDELLGIETSWRRVQGVELVAVRDGDNNIGLPRKITGREHTGNTYNTNKPDGYPLYPLYLWIRVEIVKYDGKTQANGLSQFM